MSTIQTGLLTIQDHLVLKLNEIYHDLENFNYDEKHQDISIEEVSRWKLLGEKYLSEPRNGLNILDIGCGTGFVPLQWLPWINKEDIFTCADLSSVMLSTTEENLRITNFKGLIQLTKLNGEGIPLPDQSQDIITINAVMHHLSKPFNMLMEIHRILKPGGCVVIGHEPNRNFYLKPILTWNYWVTLPFADWKLFCYEIILRLGFFEFLRKPLGKFIPELNELNELLSKVNEKLILSGVISKPIPAAEISSLLDIQSPTAGGSHPERGFALNDFISHLKGYDIEYFETYKHLSKIFLTRDWIRKYDAWLGKKFPENGSSLFCCLRKPF